MEGILYKIQYTLGNLRNLKIVMNHRNNFLLETDNIPGYG